MKTVAKTPDLCFARWGVSVRKCGGKGGKPGPCPGRAESVASTTPNEDNRREQLEAQQKGKPSAAFLNAMNKVQSGDASDDDVNFLKELGQNPMTPPAQAKAARTALRNSGYSSDGKKFLEVQTAAYKKKKKK